MVSWVKRLRLWVVVMIGALTLAGAAQASQISLTLRKTSLTPYMAELLRLSLEDQGHEAQIDVIEMAPLRYANMVSDGAPGLVAYKNRRRQIENALRIDAPLTNGLIGQRVLFVRPSDVDRFANVQSLDELRREGAVGAFGEGWFDARVWATNGLSFVERPGNWRQIYPMLASGTRGMDYFSRGALEMVVEAGEHPELAVDPHLVLSYPGDFSLFLFRDLQDYAPVIQNALTAAVDSGLRDRLLQKHFSEVYDPNALNLHGRRVLTLDLP